MIFFKIGCAYTENIANYYELGIPTWAMFPAGLGHTRR